MYQKIDDYGLIGDMRSLALVSKFGSMDYCCLPKMDSPAIFSSILDDEKGGCFSITPQDEFTSTQQYLEMTNILKCTFKTRSGTADLFDFMPVYSETELHEKDSSEIHRYLKCVEGQINIKVDFSPRPDFARIDPEMEVFNKKIKINIGNGQTLFLHISHDLEINKTDNGSAEISFILSQEEEIWFVLSFDDCAKDCINTNSLRVTIDYWKNWLKDCKEGLSFDSYDFIMQRSLLAIKLLTYKPTGALVAAATSGLPESLGGERNWDYRFSWLRDSSLALKAMFSMGHVSETDSFMRWLNIVYIKHGKERFQIMYSIEGEADLKEETLSHYKGYENSYPVRVGNGAALQKQNDIYGEVMDTALRLSDYAGKIDLDLWEFFKIICEQAIKHWQEPDDGIWEVRNGPFHFVYSKVMCWVALDRGIKIAKRYGFDADIDRWKTEAEKIRNEVLDKGYNKERNTFVQRYDSDDLDASLLLISLTGFLPPDDKRVIGTIDACIKDLMNGDFLLRYRSADGLKGEEGGFILCNFWLIEAQILAGRIDQAEELLNKTMKSANHLGLFAEEFDTKLNRMLGNFPQAFSHIGFINAVNALFEKKRKTKPEDKNILFFKDRLKKLIPLSVVLNESEPFEKSKETNDLKIAGKLKTSLLALKGKYFDVSAGRVNYCMLKKSEEYKEYLKNLSNLKYFNPLVLTTDEKKKAFWINIYNILVIHGVIELDIQHSVKEVFQFFRRIKYNIGNLYFTPDDIEHGILRGNHEHPTYKIKLFSSKDKRAKLSVENLDPRIHCALVCASSSCPPIDFYDVDNINEQLSLAARSFINRRGLIIDKENKTFYLSQIFKWYEEDFGRNMSSVKNFILENVNDDVKKFIQGNWNDFQIVYLNYDWNLNRSLDEI